MSAINPRRAGSVYSGEAPVENFTCTRLDRTRLTAGLRREELTELTFDALKQLIPIKKLLADRLREWKEITGGGYVARSLEMSKQLGESISGVAIFQLVRKYGSKIGLPQLAPHDLRRTYAQLGYEIGVPITQISTRLGHANVATTQRYLDLSLDLETTASDFIPLGGD